jgi:membrane protein implicated in regulation of membrane protease activity
MKFLVLAKYRFDLGQGFLAIINFIFVIIAASDKLSTLTHLSARWTLIVFVPLSILLVWFLGYILDKLKFIEAYQEECNNRNKMLKDILDK